MPTLKDVAEKSGVTVTTVSRILNNRGYISEKTRKKVYDTMKEINYQPNELARSLTKKRTNIIGIIVPSVMHPFFSQVVNYMEFYAYQLGYKIMVCNSYHQKSKETEYIDMLKSNKVSGIILCSRTKDIEKSLNVDMPVVTFERTAPADVISVLCDNYKGGEIAANHLVALGCKNLVHISGSIDVPTPADKRRDAFIDVCKKNNVEYKVFYTNEAQFQSMDYEEFIESIIVENNGIDGVFASSDVIASQVIHACFKNSIKIPNDLKLIGFDDVDIASLVTPRLTTIQQPIKEMCKHSIDNIINKLDGKVVPIQTVLPVTFIKRETT